MFRVLHTLFIALMMVALFAGRCLPCRDLYAKNVPKSCCQKSGACTKVPSPNSKNKPCSLEQSLLAMEKAERDIVKLQPAALVPVWTPAVTSQPLLIPALWRAEVIPTYTPPLLYVLHERFLI